MRELIRRCFFRPYRKGMGPVFRLDLFDLGRPYREGPQWNLGYCLYQDGNLLFSGDDYGCAPGHAIDSDSAVEGIMGYLTLRPGDTDDEYFENYTDAQREFCEQHAEALACEVQARFCDDTGRVIERKRRSA